MDIRNTCWIVLFVILAPHLVIAQSTIDPIGPSAITLDTIITSPPGTAGTTAPSITPSTTAPTTLPVTTSNPCADPNDFPLFGPGSCISREAYTGIFLTSIILAGISFLMVIALLIMLCTRRSRSFGSSYSGDSESRTSAAGTTPSNDTTPRRTKQAYSNKGGPITDTQTPPSTSRAPYTDVKPVSKPATRDAQPRNVKPKEPESHEMTIQQPSKRPTNTSRTQPSSSQTAAHQNGPSGQRRNKKVSSDDEMESSQF